jgi:hypothetical protein
MADVGQDKMVSGIYAPPKATTSDHHRTFSSDEDGALSLWVSLLKDGGANIEASDRIDSVRYQKVGPHARLCAVSHYIERMELRLVHYPGLGPDNASLLYPPRPIFARANQEVHLRDCECRLRIWTPVERDGPTPCRRPGGWA